MLFPYLDCEYNTLRNNRVIDKGTGNKIIVAEAGALKNCKICFYGKNCILQIGRNVIIRNNSFWFEDDGGRIVIGDNTTT